MVSKSWSIASAGRTWTRTFAVSSPAFLKAWTLPAGTVTASPGPATILLRPMRKAIVPSTTSKRSSCSGWMCAPGTAPSAESSSSISSSSPSVSAEVWMKVIFSRLTGFSIVCPA